MKFRRATELMPSRRARRILLSEQNVSLCGRGCNRVISRSIGAARHGDPRAVANARVVLPQKRKKPLIENRSSR